MAPRGLALLARPVPLKLQSEQFSTIRDMGHQMNSWMSRLSENSRNAVVYSNSVSGINNALSALGHGMYQHQQEYMGAFVTTMGAPRFQARSGQLDERGPMPNEVLSELHGAQSEREGEISSAESDYDHMNSVDDTSYLAEDGFPENELYDMYGTDYEDEEDGGSLASEEDEEVEDTMYSDEVEDTMYSEEDCVDNNDSDGC